MAGDWDYSAVPERTWEWAWRKSLHEHGTTDVVVDPRGLAWGGELLTGLSKGGYQVGCQSFEDFLRDGPPAGADGAAEHAAEIREHILAHRRPGRATQLWLVVRFEGWGEDPRLQSLSVGLSSLPCGFSFDARADRAVPTRAEHEVWRGTLTPGEHRVSLVLLYARPGWDGFQSRRIEGLSFALERGARLRVEVRVDAAFAAEILMTRLE